MNEFWNSVEGKRLAKSLFAALAILTAFLALKVVAAVKDLNYPSPVYNTISVSGTGETSSTPDVATFSFSVSADAKAVSDAQASVTAKTDAILSGLKSLGIEDKDIQTTDYSVYPKYVYQQIACLPGIVCQPSRQIPDGYTVSESVSVKVRKTEDAGKALSLAGDKGATNISSLSLTLDDPQAPLNAARLKAIDNAKSKAEELARRLGVHLGRGSHSTSSQRSHHGEAETAFGKDSAAG